MAEKPTLYVMCGLPGSGKTTYSERLRVAEAPDALVLASDDIRWTMSAGKAFKGAAERYVIDVISAYARGCLLYGRSVIVDATNLTKAKRSLLAWYAHEYGSLAELHFIQCPAAESARRSKKWIPLAAIQRLAKTFEYPGDDEGYDKIVTVDGENGWKIIKTVISSS